MKMKNLKYFFLGAGMLAFLASCTSLHSISNGIQSSASKIKGVASNFKPVVKPNVLSSNQEEEPIEFLDNLAVTPGSVYIKNKSNSLEPVMVSKKNNDYDVMPANLSDIEKANWLQLKYSIKMDVAVESINNIALLKKIDEWWGTPYCMGGNSKGCVDCSFFTMDVMSNIYNTSLKRTAAEQYEQSAKINWDQLKEGDLIFFKTEGRRSISHVGIYLTNNKFVHASTSQGVTISDLADPYWQKRLYSLGRVAPDIK
jgi:lipoprotein Spr